MSRAQKSHDELRAIYRELDREGSVTSMLAHGVIRNKHETPDRESSVAVTQEQSDLYVDAIIEGGNTVLKR